MVQKLKNLVQNAIKKPVMTANYTHMTAHTRRLYIMKSKIY